MYKIIFFGTSELAVPSLKLLMEDGRFEIVGVVTQPDRPVGRHATITPPPVKRFFNSLSKDLPLKGGAEGVGSRGEDPSADPSTGGRAPHTPTSTANETSVPVHQPETLKDESFVSWINSVGPSCDAFVIVSYGKLLPQWLLDLPKRGIVNVHPSLLPRWRGTSPIQAAIAAGDKMTGVTIMKIDAGMDSGPIIAQAEEEVLGTDTGTTLHDRLADIGASLLVFALDGYLRGDVEPVEQDDTEVTFCGILSREDGKIDWSKSAEEIERLVRAYMPWPGTWMEVGGKRVKIFTTTIAPGTTTLPALPPSLGGRVLSDSNRAPGTRLVLDGLPYVTCGQGGLLQITELQVEGKERVSGGDFLRGKSKWEN